MYQGAVRRSGGNGKAVAIGIGAMLLGAIVWAVITATTKHEFSAVAIGVGALIGLSMFTARPTKSSVALVAALLTFIGCALGEFLAVAALAAHDGGISFGQALNVESQHLGTVFKALGGKTYLFWVIGALAAFSMTIRRIQAARMMVQPPVGAAVPYQQYGQPPYGQQYPAQGQTPYNQQQGQQPYGQQYPPS